MEQLNEFYFICPLNEKPIDKHQLQNLGLERETMSGAYRQSRNSYDNEPARTWSVSQKVKSEDYDGSFAYHISRINPPYELDKFIDYHLHYYLRCGGEREKFLKHIRYVILPYLRKWYSKAPAHIELTEKWIEEAEKVKDMPAIDAKKPAFVSQYERMVDLGVVPFDLRNPVYKYRSLIDTVEILKSNKLYFPTSVQLNDKLELHPSILDLSFTKETKEKYLSGFAKRNRADLLNLSDEQFREMLLNSIEFFKNGVGIFSTCKSSTNSSIWEHYGDNHKGVCLGFVIPKNAFGSHLSFNVHYTDQPKKIKLIDDSEGDITHDIFYWFCIKQKSFAFEDEVRIIDENGYGLRPFYKEMLFEIILGKDATVDDYNLIKKVVNDVGYPVKRIGKIVIKPDTFGLSIDYFK